NFMDSDIWRHPSIYLEMSSATNADVYKRALEKEDMRRKILFGSDLPFGLITGEEYWSEETGPTFLTRDEYTWSDKELNKKFPDIVRKLTYNTYHTIKAFKDAVCSMKLDSKTEEELKRRVFLENAREIIKEA
ncbi:MAG: hypothetical protein HY350_02495, partial [Candidatus Omnitrophica bacterium]|nr:hypothetical protein [Candidatus Omnitrophota bacterium]